MNVPGVLCVNCCISLTPIGHIQWCASLLRRCLALVPHPELQVDIFVTNVKLVGPPPSHRPHQNEQTSGAPSELSLPTPSFMQHGSSSKETRASMHRSHSNSPSISSIETDGETDLDLSYYTGDFLEGEGELGHEEHVLDLTNFEGDDDTALPGEAQFSMSVRREGHARRASARHASMAFAAKRMLQSRAEERQHTSWTNSSSTQLIDRSGRLSPLVEEVSGQRRSDYSSEAGLPYIDNQDPPFVTSASTSAIESHNPDLSPLSVRQVQSTRERPVLTVDPRAPRVSSEPLSRRLSAVSQTSAWSDTRSIAALISQTDVEEAAGKPLRLELDDQEMDDVSVVAELARPGRPKLDRILADEVQHSKGAVIVGCKSSCHERTDVSDTHVTLSLLQVAGPHH